MSGVTLKTCITVYIMAAAFTLVAAVPTPSTSATTTSQELESENAVSTAAPAVLAFNQSQCSTNGGSAAVNFSLCLGHFAVGKYLENVTIGQCPNGPLPPITEVVGDMQYPFCGKSGSLELHDLISVLRTYHSLAIQAASTTTEPAERLSMDIISEMLKGLVQNYFRVISPNHCSCTNASNCVKTVDFTESRLNLACLTNNCNLAAYVSQHIRSDLSLILTKYQKLLKSNSLEFKSGCPISVFCPEDCHQWVDEYIQADSPAYPSAAQACRDLNLYRNCE